MTSIEIHSLIDGMFTVRYLTATEAAAYLCWILHNRGEIPSAGAFKGITPVKCPPDVSLSTKKLYRAVQMLHEENIILFTDRRVNNGKGRPAQVININPEHTQYVQQAARAWEVFAQAENARYEQLQKSNFLLFA